MYYNIVEINVENTRRDRYIAFILIYIWLKFMVNVGREYAATWILWDY